MSVSKTFEMAFVVGAALQAQFATVMNKATQKTTNLEKAVQNLQKANSDISSVLKQREATEKARNEWTSAAKSAEQLKRTLLGMSNPSKSLVAEFNRMESASLKAKNAWIAQKNALAKLETEAKTAGISFDTLVKKQTALQKRIKFAENGKSRLDAGMNLINSSKGYAATTGIAMFSQMAGAVKTGANFDAAMARVEAVSGASGEDLLALREQAKALGKSTVWSSSQAAEGQQFLAMAGFSKDQILKSMPGMLDLASAGGIDLGSAADIGSNILTGMGLDASEMGRVGDVLTNTFTKSNTNLSMLGETMKYAAPVAKSLGVSLEETAAMAGKLGDAGIQGSMAGTTLRAVMLRLSAPSKQGAEALDALGVKTTDAAGNMRKIPDILADLNQAMAKMPEAQKAAYTKAIFETEAMSGAFVLMEQAGKGALQEFTEAVKKTGTSQQVAAAQNNNLVGDYKAFTSAIEGLTIAFYEKLEPALRKITQVGTQAVSWVTDFVNENPKITAAFGTFAGGIGAFASAALPAFTLFKTGCFIFGLFKSAIGATQIAMAAFNLVLSANPIGLVVTAIGTAIAAGVLLYQNWDTVKEGAQALWTKIQQTFSEFRVFIGGAFQSAVNAVSEPLSALQSMIVSGMDFVTQGFHGAFSGLGSFVGGAFESAMMAAKTPINAMIAMINSVIEKINEYSNVQVPSWVPGIGGQGLGFQLNPIPQLADGGIATSSTLANIGEGAEPEAILPLSCLDSMLGNSTASPAPSVNVNLTVNVQGTGNAASDVRQAASAAAFDLKRELERLLANERRLAY